MLCCVCVYTRRCAVQGRSHLAHDPSYRLPVTDAFAFNVNVKAGHDGLAGLDGGPAGGGGGSGSGTGGPAGPAGAPVGYNVCLDDPDSGETGITHMNPDQIRAEFKR